MVVEVAREGGSGLEEVVEVLLDVQGFLIGGRETSPTEDSPTDQNSTIIHWIGSKLSVPSCDIGTEETHTN